MQRFQMRCLILPRCRDRDSRFRVLEQNPDQFARRVPQAPTIATPIMFVTYARRFAPRRGSRGPLRARIPVRIAASIHESQAMAGIATPAATSCAS